MAGCRAAADAMFGQLAAKVKAVGGRCLVYYETHRGDDTPFAKVQIGATALPESTGHAHAVPIEDGAVAADGAGGDALAGPDTEEPSAVARTVKLQRARIWSCILSKSVSLSKGPVAAYASEARAFMHI